MLKSHLSKMFFLLFTVLFSGAVFCFAAVPTPTVSVSISPGSATVKVKSANDAEEIGKNTAQYTISASCDPSSLETEEVKPVDPAWIGVCSGITFIPPKNVQPEPPSPGDPNVSALTGTNSWTTKVSAPYAGQWKLKFTATVTYYVWDKKKEEYVLNEDGSKATFGPYTGTGTCNFIATSKPFLVEISTNEAIVRKADAVPANGSSVAVPAQRYNYEISAKLIDSDVPRTIIFSNNGVGQVRFGGITYDHPEDPDYFDKNDPAIAPSISFTFEPNEEKFFFISGEVASINHLDAMVIATCDNEIVGSRNLTVLWVNLSLKKTGQVSEENEKREIWPTLFAEKENPYGLGKRYTSSYVGQNQVWGYGFEVCGEVLPNDFPRNILLLRDCHDESIINGNKEIKKEFGDIGKSSNDTSDLPLLDLKPPLTYDLDFPALGLPLELPNPFIIIARKNFREFAALGADKSRCSNILQFYVVISISGEIQNGKAVVHDANFDAILETGTFPTP